MIYRFTSFFTMLCLSATLIGCSALFSEQEWSENYALMEGVQSTTPQAIDGKVSTIGEAVFPAEVAAMSPASEVIITLPEKKLIRRIVVHSDNLLEFDIHMDKGSLTSNRDWALVKEVKSVKSNPMQLSILAPFPTNRVRLRVLETKDDALKTREFRSRMPGYRRVSNRRAAGKIREIELYGYKTAEQVAAEDASESREKELDDLLDLE